MQITYIILTEKQRDKHADYRHCPDKNTDRQQCRLQITLTEKQTERPRCRLQVTLTEKKKRQRRRLQTLHTDKETGKDANRRQRISF